MAKVWIASEEQWGLDQAERYADRLHEALTGLAVGKRIGHAAPVGDYLVLRVQSHMIYYRMTRARVRVVRILHVRQDAESALGRR